MAIVRPCAGFLETAGGLLDSHHDRNPCGDYAVLLTITKECKERESRGVAVRQFAPLARVHAASGSGRNAVHSNLALFLGAGSGLAEQINNPILDRICRSPYPFTRLCEEVAQHCNIFINPQLFKRFSEPAGYMADFCHTSVRQLADFAAPECGARQIFLKNEKTLFNIVVESFGGAGGAAKNQCGY